MHKLLHIIPYDQFIPAQNGGALRCYHLSVELAKYFNVTVLTFQPKESITDIRFEDIRVLNPKEKLQPKGFAQKIKNAIKYRLYKRSLKGPAQATVLQFYPVLKELAKSESFDYVLMEHLEGIEMGPIIKRLFPKIILIADQHNVDHLLFKQYYNLNESKNLKQYNNLKIQESNLYKNADYFFACSEKDKDKLFELNKNRIQGFVVPNGTSIKDSPNLNTDYTRPSLIFCGALDTEPNKNGLLWFYKAIWPKLIEDIPNITLTVIGRNGNDVAYLPLKNHAKINFIGAVDDVAPYYVQSHLAIVPLLEGSGTRLKILEGMSFGLPVISTSIGAEGISYTNNRNIIIADNEKLFRESIISLFENPEHLNNLGMQGLALVREKYDWVKIGNHTAEIITHLEEKL